MKGLFRFIITSIVTIIFSTSILAQEVALGETFLAGQTWHLIQQTSSVGKMIARDANGGTHLTWTWSPTADGATRHVYYGFADDGEGDIAAQFEDAAEADVENRSGYSSLTLRPTAEGDVATLFFHGSSKGIAAFDFARGWGAFGSFYFDPPGEVIPINAKGCVGREGRMFLAAGVHNPMAGDPNFVLTVWPADPQGDDNWNVGERAVPEQITGLSYALTASQASDKVAIVWHHNLIGVPGPEEWSGRLEHQMNNDIYAVIAEDGRVWDWDHPINITKTILPDAEREGIAALGDTLRPYPDLDAIWVGDVLHVVFTTRGFWADLADELVPPVQAITVSESLIWHWDSASDSLTLVAKGWFPNDIDGSSFNSNVCKPSLGVHENGNLICVFQQASRANEDEEGFWYGDVAVSFSQDGSEWSEAINLTATQPEDDGAVEYVNEIYPSLAERVDENLHISYLLRAESGLDQDVISKFTYHRVAVADLGDYVPLELPRDDFQYHNRGELSVVEQDQPAPNDFRLTSIYPNPFNGRTNISFDTYHEANVRVEVLDLTGRTVVQLVGGALKTGSHSITWDASQMQSGVYLLKITSGNETTARKIVLIR